MKCSSSYLDFWFDHFVFGWMRSLPAPGTVLANWSTPCMNYYLTILTPDNRTRIGFSASPQMAFVPLYSLLSPTLPNNPLVQFKYVPYASKNFLLLFRLVSSQSLSPVSYVLLREWHSSLGWNPLGDEVTPFPTAEEAAAVTTTASSFPFPKSTPIPAEEAPLFPIVLVGDISQANTPVRTSQFQKYPYTKWDCPKRKTKTIYKLY